MLLMQNNVVSSYVRSRDESHHRRAAAHHHQQQQHHQEFNKPPPWNSVAAAASLEKFWPHEALEHPVRQLNWASVASWFMRPDARAAAAPTQDTLPAPTVCTSIRCTVPGCSCECFTPGKIHIRYCESCSHGWVPHALDKLGFRHMLGGQNAVEPVQLNVAFDIASLVLYGCQALPIRLKILLDRLFSVLQRDEVVQVLRGFGWTQEDYARGYILQEPHGAVLDRWNICSPEEEPLVLQQFLRFGETRAITQQLLMHGLSGGLPRAAEADIKRLLDARDQERRGGSGGHHHPSTPKSLAPPPPVSQSSVQPPPPSPVASRGQQPQSQTLPPPLPQQQQAPLSPQHRLGFRLPPTGLTCTPTSTPSSPPTSSASSPLNKLQNMRPFDFRKITLPERRRASEDNASVPQNLSISNSVNSSPVCLPPPPPAPSSMLGHKSPSSDFYHGSTTAASSEFGSDDDEDDEENSQSALNLSRDSPGFVKQRLGHHRKSVTPVKRHWGSSGLPANLGTQLINPATGKKRVQCNVCLKTFCDKGALKIHYSAVHLREMHKCTVEGCNMMFSSRRSRNRHSANPNPKLHSPHLRRKISPHDGRSSQNHPLLMPPLAGLSPLSFGPFPLLTPPPPELRHHAAALDLKQSLDLSTPRRDSRKSISGNESSDQADDFVMYDDDEDGIVIEGDEDMVSQNGEKSDGGPASKMGRYQKMSESEDDDGVMSNVEDSNEDSLSVVDSQSVKEESGPENLVTKSSRKRKNQNPTRCAVSASAASHEGMSDDDSCTDVYQRRTPEKRPELVDKGQDLSVKAIEEEVENNNTITMKKEPVEKYTKDDADADKEPNDLRVHLNNDEATNLSVKRESSPEEAKTTKIKTEDNVVDTSNALRHLESLSQGHFGSESYRPGDPPSPARSNASSASSNGGDSDAEVYGHFQDGAFVAAMEVPIDKDNPRMCTACGKVFQNHFSVKTHYQNVHLKLMHKCTVDGCNAAFPSKRSRDRHSANLNLHRKLLSTSLTDKAAASLFLESHLTPHSLHPEFLARLYADTHLPTANLLNGDRLVPGHPLFPYPLGLTSFRGFPHLGGGGGGGPPLENGGGGGVGRNSSSVGSHSPQSAGHTSPHLVLADDDDDARVDSDGRLVCRYCSPSSSSSSSSASSTVNFESPQRLREHIESNHLADCHRCTHADCPLVFVSVKRRNAHSEDDTAHPRPPS